MTFDSTHIVIRERGFAELLDLALIVLRVHFAPLMLALVAGAAPFAVLNYFLLGDLLEETVFYTAEGYVYWLAVLIILEIPLATGFMTLYLGQVTFSDRTDAGRIVKDYFRSLPQMLWYQVFWRAVCYPLHITMLLPYVRWPYLTELILLERNAYMAGKKRRLTTKRRSNNLHGGAEGELFGRAILSVLAGGLLLLALTVGVPKALEMLFNVTFETRTTLLFVLPAVAWFVAGYFAVVRFLSYLDLRIRREGWEVELQMRAEALRMSRVMGQGVAG